MRVLCDSVRSAAYQAPFTSLPIDGEDVHMGLDEEPTMPGPMYGLPAVLA